MFLDPHCHHRTDILAKPLDPPAQPAYTDIMSNDTPRQEGFAILTTLTLLLFTFAALASCGSSGGSAGTGTPEIPRYYADEPNDAWQFANIIPCQDDVIYEVEGNMHYGDLDYIACELPKGPGPTNYYVTVDYAEGWPMAVQAAWYTPAGTPTHLWGGYDEWGDGGMSFQTAVNGSAGYLVLTIRQSQLPVPDETRYTFTVEVL